jgi:hypothetical protein
MAAKTEWCGEILGRAKIASAGIAGVEEQDRILHITINLLNVMPTREVHGPEGTGKVSNHYWMNSLPFVKHPS